MNSEIQLIFKKLDIKVNFITKVKTYANKLYKVETNKGNFYLKIYDDKKQSKVGFKLSKLYPLLLKHKIPVPNVLKFDSSLKIVKHPYLILTEIEGDSLENVYKKLSKKELLKFYYDLGSVLAKIHSITFEKFGETLDGKTLKGFSEIKDQGPFKTWYEMHNKIILQRLSYLKNSSFEDLIQPIKKWYKNNRKLINYNITPRLLHEDLNQKNIIIKNKKLSGIIDFDGAFIGHNEEEFMRTEGAHFFDKPELKEVFFKGYTKKIKLDKGYEQRRLFYYLSRMLVGMRCLIQFGKNYVSDVKKEEEIIRKEINEILNNKKINFDKNKRNT